MNKKVALSVLSATVFASMAASAFAAPKSGLYIGGNVDKYYSMNTLLGGMSSSALDQFSTEIGSAGFSNLIYVDFDGKGASIADIMSATDFESAKKDLTADKFEGVYSNIKADGSADGTYDPRNDAIDTPTGELKVESVSAINKLQIKVAFTAKVDEASATNTANYALNGNVLSTGAPGDATAELQEDGKTVIITAGTTGGFTGTTFVGNTGYVLTIDNVKNEDETVTLDDVKSSSFTYSDTVAPTVAKVEAKAVTSTKQVTVTFSEPVKGEGLYKINGKVATFTPGAPSKTITLTSADALVGNTTYTLEVLNEKDAEGNYISPNPSTKTFSVDIDSSADGVDKVEVKGDDTIRVTFKEDMTVSTVTTAGNIKIVDANLNDIHNGGTVVVAVNPVGTSKKQFDVTLSGTGAKALFNSTTKKLNGTLVFTSNLKDLSGNAVTAASEAVSLTLDETAPTITKSEWYKAGSTFDGATVGANGLLVLTFSEDLTTLPATLTEGTDFTAIKDDGAVETVGDLTPAFKTGSKTVVKLTPATAAFGSLTNETVRLAGNLFTDESIGANKAAAAVLTVDVKNGASNGDTQKPVVNNVASGASKPNTIVVTFGEAVSGLDAATVTNVANYRIDGAPLPAGSYVTTTGSTATLNLPAEAIDTTRDYSITVTGIKDKAGNVAEMFTKTISLTEDKLPVLTSAAFNADGTVSLTFSEAVSSAVDADFAVTLNGGSTVLNAAQYNAADGTGADAGKVVITLVSTPDLVDGAFIDVDNSGATFNTGDIRVADITKVSVKTNAASTTVDGSANSLKDNVSVTATK